MGQPIFTLNARGNIMLEVMQGYFGLDRSQMLSEINASFSGLLEILKAKGVDYASLKNALVPCPDRNEAAFIFDTTQIQSAGTGSKHLSVFSRRSTRVPLTAFFAVT